MDREYRTTEKHICSIASTGGDSSRQDTGHFGLGLSIAREIMDAHHGSLTVSDTPGGGSTFTLILNNYRKKP